MTNESLPILFEEYQLTESQRQLFHNVRDLKNMPALLQTLSDVST